MSASDVALVMYPAEKLRADLLQERHHLAEEIILALRSRLREDYPGMPDIYDGPAWHEFEKVWKP